MFVSEPRRISPRQKWKLSKYSQLSPCGHLAIMDTPLIPTAAKSPAKVADVWLKQTPTITDSRYYGLTDTLFSPEDTILLF